MQLLMLRMPVWSPGRSEVSHYKEEKARRRRAPSGHLYLNTMSVFSGLAAVAKGMAITFKEMLSPTIVENYPDGPGP